MLKKSFQQLQSFDLYDRKDMYKLVAGSSSRSCHDYALHTAEPLMGLLLRKYRKGVLLYNNNFSSYLILMFCCYRHLKADHKKIFPSGKNCMHVLEHFL
jgi:hypothetical protein